MDFTYRSETIGFPDVHPWDGMEVCLCGSTTYWMEWLDAQRLLTIKGYRFTTVGQFGNSLHAHVPQGSANPVIKELHFYKIANADFVYLVHPSYLGASTKQEILFATYIGRPIITFNGTDWLRLTFDNLKVGERVPPHLRHYDIVGEWLDEHGLYCNDTKPVTYCVVGYFEHDTGVILDGYINGERKLVTTFNQYLDKVSGEVTHTTHSSVQIYQLEGTERKWLCSTDKAQAEHLSKWLGSHPNINQHTVADAIDAAVLAQKMGIDTYF